MVKYPLLILFGIVFGLLDLGVNGQGPISPPNCSASTNYQWAYNSLDQSPCVVATFLGQACIAGYGIVPINSSEYYNGPKTEQNNPCECSSVMYIMLSACGACQGGLFTSWSGYNQNCSVVYPMIFPEDIPEGTKIPKWAFQNVTAENNFNPVEARAVGDLPESTGIAKATGTTSPAPTPTTPTTATSTTPSPTHKKSDAGAIAGGVVGGVVAACTVIVAAAYYWRRRQRRRRRSPSSAFDIDDVKARPFQMSTHSTLLSSSNMTGPGFHASVPSMSVPPSSPGQKLYNPNDPSTFPNSVLSMSPSPPPMLQNQNQNGTGHSPQSSETGMTGYFSGNFHSVGMSPNRRQEAPEI